MLAGIEQGKFLAKGWSVEHSVALVFFASPKTWQCQGRTLRSGEDEQLHAIQISSVWHTTHRWRTRVTEVSARTPRPVHIWAKEVWSQTGTAMQACHAIFAAPGYWFQGIAAPEFSEAQIFVRNRDVN